MATRKAPAVKPYIIRDTREKEGKGWNFSGGEASFWAGTISKGVKTGDYTIEGYENIMCIERKGSPSEFFGNFFDDYKRFQRELDRMRLFPVAAIVLEFDFYDVIHWQKNSQIPSSMKLKIGQYAFLSKITDLHIAYPNIQVIYAGQFGKEVAGSLLKKAYLQYGKS
jgi:hypothetical protein